MASTRWIERAREIVRDTLWLDWDGEGEAAVNGVPPLGEVAASDGICDCGAPLSRRTAGRVCRRCGREFEEV